MMKTTNGSSIDSSLLESMHTSLGSASSDVDSSVIADFYRGRSIFITGATGFMGKVLVEKLLRSCDHINTIYILLRTKKNVEPQARLEELLSNKIFDRVRQDNASQLSKVIAVAGDITLPQMGIAPADYQTLVQEVSIVFHSAATVKFDEPLGVSILYNTLGTRYVLELCKKIQKLVALVHVSTAYANCNRHEIDEIFYPAPAPPQKVIELKEWMSDETLDKITPALLENRPNTYTYTKALAEALLAAEAGEDFPLAIVRPSIVTAAWREPYPGWIDNINGPTGLVLACSKGILRTMLYNSKACADLIPVDMVINMMISVAWYTATRRPSSIQIYNCTSGSLNGILWGDIARTVFPNILAYPCEQVFRYPAGSFKENRTLNNVCNLLDHKMPAYAFDMAMRLIGKKPILVRISQKLERAIGALEWFTTRDWHFKSNNVMKLSHELQGVDQKIFHFDVRNLDWEPYWKDYVLGIRKFILKEDDSTLPQARKNLQKVYVRKQLLSAVLLITTSYMVLAQVPGVSSLCESILSSLGQLGGSLVSSYVPESLLPAAGGSFFTSFLSAST